MSNQWLDEFDILKDFELLHPATHHVRDTSGPVVVHALKHTDKPNREFLEDDAKLECQFSGSDDEFEHTYLGPDLTKITALLQAAKLYEDPIPSGPIQLMKSDSPKNNISRKNSPSGSNEKKSLANQSRAHIPNNRNVCTKWKDASTKQPWRTSQDSNDKKLASRKKSRSPNKTANKCNTSWNKVGSGDTTQEITKKTSGSNCSYASSSPYLSSSPVVPVVSLAERKLKAKRNILMTTLLNGLEEQGKDIIETNETIPFTSKANMNPRENKLMSPEEKNMMVESKKENAMIEVKRENMNIEYVILPFKDIDEEECNHRNTSIGVKDSNWMIKQSEGQIKPPIHNVDTQFGWSMSKATPTIERNLYQDWSPVNETKSITNIGQYKPSPNFEKIKQKLAAKDIVKEKTADDEWLATKVGEAEEAFERKKKMRERKLKLLAEQASSVATLESCVSDQISIAASE